MTDIPWMTWAENELGEHEIPGPKSNSRIIQYRDISGLKLGGDDGEVPWCKIFVNSAFVECGLPIDKNAMALSIKSDRNFVQLDGPAYGCVVAFWRGKPKAGTGHIGFYVGETVNGARLLILGGNQSDAVSRAFFHRSGISMGVVGYYWPGSVPRPETKKVIVKDTGAPVATAV